MDIQKLDLREEAQNVIDIFDAHDFPQLECPYCGGILDAMIMPIDDKTVIGLTCGCDKWEMLEAAIAIEKLDTKETT